MLADQGWEAVARAHRLPLNLLPRGSLLVVLNLDSTSFATVR